MSLCGGFTEFRAASEEEVVMINKLSEEIKAQVNGEFTIDSLATQVVNGINYKVKVKVGETEQVIRLHSDFTNTNVTLRPAAE